MIRKVVRFLIMRITYFCNLLTWYLLSQVSQPVINKTEKKSLLLICQSLCKEKDKPISFCLETSNLISPLMKRTVKDHVKNLFCLLHKLAILFKFDKCWFKTLLNDFIEGQPSHFWASELHAKFCLVKKPQQLSIHPDSWFEICLSSSLKNEPRNSWLYIHRTFIICVKLFYDLETVYDLLLVASYLADKRKILMLLEFFALHLFF